MINSVKNDWVVGCFCFYIVTNIININTVNFSFVR